jgi:hypothetical protein
LPTLIRVGQNWTERRRSYDQNDVATGFWGFGGTILPQRRTVDQLAVVVVVVVVA